MTDDEDLAATIAARLGSRTLATAESCTAGRVAESFATVEKATQFLRGGLVAYQESVKRALLGVTAESMLTRQAAAEMAAGAADLFSADVTVSTTGLAGEEPQDGVPGRTVFIGTFVDGRVRATEHHFEGSPDQVCESARRQALVELATRLCS
ncbi:MAG: CinA domain protein [Ilumatobacteraceae bacterium]|nr:CinA domain protein [Ilumatobacteraceae bacterium]